MSESGEVHQAQCGPDLTHSSQLEADWKQSGLFAVLEHARSSSSSSSRLRHFGFKAILQSNYSKYKMNSSLAHSTVREEVININKTVFVCKITNEKEICTIKRQMQRRSGALPGVLKLSVLQLCFEVSVIPHRLCRTK